MVSTCQCLVLEDPGFSVILAWDGKIIEGHAQEVWIHRAAINPPLDGVGGMFNGRVEVPIKLVAKFSECRRGSVVEDIKDVGAELRTWSAWRMGWGREDAADG